MKGRGGVLAGAGPPDAQHQGNVHRASEGGPPAAPQLPAGISPAVLQQYLAYMQQRNTSSGSLATPGSGMPPQQQQQQQQHMQ